MYTHIWGKYLPIIKILLKRSIAEEQVFSLNVSDFKLAGAARKSGYKFIIQFSKGRLDNVINSDMAKDFASALVDDAAIKALLVQNDYHISMNSKFQLTIKCVSPTLLETAVENEELIATDTVVS